MNAFPFPRPSFRGAILWQRSRHALAITPHGGVLAWSLFAIALGLPLVFVEPLWSWIRTYWWVAAGAIVVPNVLMSTSIAIGAGGVTARRALTGFRRSVARPLGGEFRRTLPVYLGEPDHDEDIDVDEDTGARTVHYVHPEGNIVFDCVFAGPTAAWLNAQLHRIQSLQLPAARVMEHPPTGDECTR